MELEEAKKLFKESIDEAKTPIDLISILLEKFYEKGAMNEKEEPMKPNRYYFNKYLFKCGRCRKVLDIVEHDYCPQCGRRMEAENEEG